MKESAGRIRSGPEAVIIYRERYQKKKVREKHHKRKKTKRKNQNKS